MKWRTPIAGDEREYLNRGWSRSDEDQGTNEMSLVERLTDDLQECESRYMELSGQLRAAVREREDWNGKHQIAVMEIDKLVSVLERHGFRRCDIPACNCGSWHDGT